MAFREKMQGLGECPLCGRTALCARGERGIRMGIEGPGALLLKDGKNLCGACVRRLRIMYPLQYRFDDATREVVTQDALHDLTTDEALEAARKVVVFREAMREKYGFRNAVFEVDAMTECKGGFFSPPLVTVFGQVLYGTFFLFDEVTILSGGNETKATLSAIDTYTCRNPMTAENLKDWMQRVDPATKIGETGYPCQFVIQARGISVRHGDLIVKD